MVNRKAFLQLLNNGGTGQVRVLHDGDMVCALIGPNLQEGIAGFGSTVPDALRDLAAEFELKPLEAVAGDFGNGTDRLDASIAREHKWNSGYCVNCGLQRNPITEAGVCESAMAPQRYIRKDEEVPVINTAEQLGTSLANARQVGGQHYKGTRIEHWDWAAANDLDYFQGQITKYVARWKSKNGIQDLEKAKHFLDKYMELARATQPVEFEMQQPIVDDICRCTHRLPPPAGSKCQTCGKKVVMWIGTQRMCQCGPARLPDLTAPSPRCFRCKLPY